MKTHLTGPALGGMTERWQNHGGKTALYSWIRDSQAMIAIGENDRAQQLWEEWSPTIMNSFHNLSDEDMEAVISYIETSYYAVCFDAREEVGAP